MRRATSSFSGLGILRFLGTLLILTIGASLRGVSQEPISNPTCSCPTNDTCLANAGEPPEINADPCLYPGGCPNTYTAVGGCCQANASPIILDLSGEGFHLSNAAGGVWFRPFSQYQDQYMVAWPLQGSKNGWLVLDRNQNGLIDDFGELFGDQTPQPVPPPGGHKNGFAALAVFDSPSEGGNGDGWISKEDRIFSKLRVWVDENHDGVSQPNELLTLEQAGVERISLNYHESKYVDANGNIFRYRSIVRDVRGSETSKVIYDVFVRVGSRAQDQSTSKSMKKDWPQMQLACRLCAGYWLLQRGANTDD